MAHPPLGATPQDRTYTPEEGHGHLAPKEAGKHRWIAIVAHVLTEDMAAGAHEGTGQVLLDQTSIIDLSIGCVDCEQIYDPHAGPCPAEPYRGFDRG